MADPIETPYSDSLEALWGASGTCETLINSSAPTKTQSAFLNWLQGNPNPDWASLGLKNAIEKAANDPDLPTMPIPGSQP